MPLGVGSPLAPPPPLRLARPRDGGLEFGVEPDAPHGGALLAKALPFPGARAIDGGVVSGLRFPDPGDLDPLPPVHPPLGGVLPGLADAQGCEGQNLERIAVRPGDRGLLDESVVDPAG